MYKTLLLRLAYSMVRKYLFRFFLNLLMTLFMWSIKFKRQLNKYFYKPVVLPNPTDIPIDFCPPPQKNEPKTTIPVQ